MPTTFGKFKTDIRARIWPPGSAEPDNLVLPHDKDFIDALIDLQTWVQCLQQDNTDLFPQCSTTYNCGLTVIGAPRGIIKKLSVIDQIDPDTHLEDTEAATDYCAEITYREVDYCHIRRYLDLSHQCGTCVDMYQFFDLDVWGNHRLYPTPTDEGVPAGLPLLPMGFHYPQTSTDRSWGRSPYGLWAKERGNIYVAPWIQSTETIKLLWDGIKRSWNTGDPVDDDPLLAQAVEAYVRWQHAKKWDKDQEAAADALGDYNNARAMLIHQCREETRARACEPSHARASTLGVSTLYYNDDQSFTAQCPDGQTGNPVTVTIQSGTVGSNVSVADANAKAKSQAQAQAEAQLVCSAVPTTYWNTVEGRYTATCAVDGTLEDGAPTPEGDSVTVIVPVSSVSSTVSVAAANAAAQAQAETNAIAQLVCTYRNAPQTSTKACPNGTNEVSATVPAGQFSAASQAAADELAKNQADNDAMAAFAGTDCGSGPTGTYWNTAQQGYGQASCSLPFTGVPTITRVIVAMPAHMFSDTNLALANMRAIQVANQFAFSVAASRAQQQLCGNYSCTYPNP